MKSQASYIVFVVSGPVLFFLLPVTLLLTAPIARRVRSPMVAGSLSALASAAVVGTLTALYLTVN